MTIDFTSIYRMDMVCRSYFGDALEKSDDGEYVRFEDVVAILKVNGIECRTTETVANEKFEAEMVEKFGKDWR